MINAKNHNNINKRALNWQAVLRQSKFWKNIQSVKQVHRTVDRILHSIAVIMQVEQYAAFLGTFKTLYMKNNLKSYVEMKFSTNLSWKIQIVFLGLL